MENMEKIFQTLNGISSEIAWLIFLVMFFLLQLSMYSKRVSNAFAPLHLRVIITLILCAGIIFQELIDTEPGEAQMTTGVTVFTLLFIAVNFILAAYYVVYNKRDPYRSFHWYNIAYLIFTHGLIIGMFIFSLGLVDIGSDLNLQGPALILTLLAATVTVVTVRLQGKLENFDRHLSRGENLF